VQRVSSNNPAGCDNRSPEQTSRSAESEVDRMLDGTISDGRVEPRDIDSRSAYSVLLRPSIQLVLTIACVFAGVAFVFGDSSIPRLHYINLLVALFVVAVFFQKYYGAYSSKTSTITDILTAKTLAWGCTFLFLTLIVTLSELRNIPRLFLFSLVSISYAVDLLLTLGKYNGRIKTDETYTSSSTDEKTVQYPMSYSKAAIGLGILIISILGTMIIKAMDLRLYVHYEQLFTIIIGSWVISVGLTHAYSLERHRNVYYELAPVLKLGITMTLIAGIFYWYGQIDYVSRGVLYGSIAIFTGLQLLAVLRQTRKDPAMARDTIVPSLESREPKEIGVDLEEKTGNGQFQLAKYLPKQVLLKERVELTEWLQRILPAVEPKDVSILFSTEHEYMQEIGNGDSKKVVINLHGLNYVKRLNSCLRVLRGRVQENGYLVTWVHPLDTTYARLRASMPKNVFVFFYPIHFLLFRVVPKLPVVGKIYFYFNKGCNPNISKAEVLGRLVYNGFSIVACTEIDHKLYVVARADRPYLSVEPSFGPIAKLSRIGYQGRRITVYKFRTMYPYSEFIQDEIYNANRQIDGRSKFVNDYRITAWGNVLRKYWIDEVPQVYNWLKGDIGLVGVRALSEHKFSLYPPEMQQLRIQYKPGLIPPLYADLPETFEEILRSEKTYLVKWSHRPFVTDCRYFVKALYNILVNGARSS